MSRYTQPVKSARGSNLRGGGNPNHPPAQAVSTYRDGRRWERVEAFMENRSTRFHAPNPAGRGSFCPFLCRSSLRYARYLPLLAPRTEQKSPPSPTTPLCRYSLGGFAHFAASVSIGAVEFHHLVV